MTWCTVPLGEVIRLKRGHDLPSGQRVPGDVPIVSSSGITGYHNVAQARGPGVVTGRYGTLGEVHYIETDYWPLNTALYVEDFKGNHPRYIAYLLRTLELGSQNAAGAVPGVNRNALHQLQVSVPDVNTQVRIAAVLSAYDDLIATNQRRIALLEDAVRRLYREWFVHLRFPGHESVLVKDGLPTGWSVRNLFDICEVDYGFPFKADQFNTNGVGMPAVRIRDIPEVATSTFTTEEVDSSYVVKRGDLLIGMDGIFHMNHWAGEDALLVQRVCRVRPKDESLRAYVGLALREPIKNFETTIQGATVAHLGAKHLKQIELLIPTAMDAHLDYLNEALWQQIQLREVNCKLYRARDLLLPRVMSGHLDVSGIRLPDEVAA
jgi:type I restriction enzyme S subunit